MKKKLKISRNSLCPCGSGKKNKNCCEGKVDWNRIIKEGKDEIPYLSIRGRNILFINAISDILQLDTIIDPSMLNSLKNYKKAFNPITVKKIHQALIEIWPPNTKIQNVLENINTDISGLYIGDHRPEYILKGILRHSIYANKIIVIDPFVYPLSVKDEYNPILNPEKYQVQTLRNVNFWLWLSPWIDEGIVEIIRTPGDFDKKLNWDLMQKQYKKYKEHQEYHNAVDKSTAELTRRESKEFTFKDILLSSPNDYLEKKFYDLGLEKYGMPFEEFIKYIEKKREEDPNFLKPLLSEEMPGQLLTFSSGTSYEMSKLITNLTNSYLLTDIYSKWKEIELDRENCNIVNKEWAPFAKAFQDLELKFLNNIELKHALILRKEKRLESLRVFLRKIWKSACSIEPFSEYNTKLLADELKDEISKANEEWKEIDHKLIEWLGIDAVGGLTTYLVSGEVLFLAAAAIAGSTKLISAQLQRNSFKNKFPAAFFMNIKK